MPEITKSGAKLRLFIVTHKYTDLYFIFFFQTPTPGRQANLGLRLPNRPSAVASHIVRHHHRIAHPHRPPSSSDCANGAIHHHRRKTAEERFNTLARGWLAYPVTPTHAHLPPKSGCINAIPACANGALLLATPPARRGGTPPLCASEMRYFPLSARRIPIEKTAIIALRQRRDTPP